MRVAADISFSRLNWDISLRDGGIAGGRRRGRADEEHGNEAVESRILLLRQAMDKAQFVFNLVMLSFSTRFLAISRSFVVA